MKIVKSLMLMAVGAATVLLYQKYGDKVMDMAEDMLIKHNCNCELED